MRTKLYSYFDSFFEFILMIFAPEKHFCLFKRRMKLEMKIDSILYLRDSYNDCLREISSLREKLAAMELKQRADQKSSVESKKTVHAQAYQIQALERQLTSAVSLNGTLGEIKQQWINYHIHQLNNNSYGAGLFYELYECRKQEAVTRFLCQYSALLTPEEINTLKQETDYQENFEPYTEVDEETGQTLTVHELAYKMANGLM